ncbi:hypothetical protein BDN70DRAFT_918989 [Pholiota conissans]|uniref:F-box domain-containing protein n=1 Tax=Pholiota conissans TaxID=109636 RepID=A0A9P5Z8M9_9AGAR|nr:hypothetical protein BDN70DRAFT_918989 [Pholiota conissans]
MQATNTLHPEDFMDPIDMDTLSFLDDENVTVEEKLRTIDENIEKHQKIFDKAQAAISVLKARRNVLIPISCIPSEILEHIFSFVGCQSTVTDPVARASQQHLERVALTHVCRQWRSIAVNSSSLWVSLPIRMNKWIRDILNRSKDTLHSVDIGLTELHDLTTGSGCLFAFQNTHRLKEICIWGIDQLTALFLSSRLPKSAPKLESFKLVGHPIVGGPPNIPNNVLNDTPRLRLLHLVNCDIDWGIHKLLQCSLTNLQLTDINPNNMPTGKQFIAVLKKMHGLQVLNLGNALPPRDIHGTSSWGPENIHLEKLQALRIKSSSTPAEDFFRNVTFPPTAVVHTILHPSEGNADFSSVLFEIGRSYSDASVCSQSLILSVIKPWGLQLRLLPELSHNYDVDERLVAAPGPLVAVMLDMTFHCPDATALQKLASDIFACGVNLHDIKHAYLLSMGDTLLPETLAKTIGKLPGLDLVIVKSSSIAAFFKAMMDFNLPSGGAAESENPIQPYFATVSSVCLSSIAFVTEEKGTAGSSKSKPFYMPEFLTQRNNLGKPLERLVLRNCTGINKEFQATIEKVVGKVDVRHNMTATSGRSTKG